MNEYSQKFQEMTRGNALNNTEKAEINILHKNGFSGSEIGNEVGRSRQTVNHYISRPMYVGPETRGRKRKTSDRDERAISRAGSNKMTSSRRIKNDLQLDISSRTVRQVLHDDGNLDYTKNGKALSTHLQFVRNV